MYHKLTRNQSLAANDVDTVATYLAETAVSNREKRANPIDWVQQNMVQPATPLVQQLGVSDPQTAGDIAKHLSWGLLGAGGGAALGLGSSMLAPSKKRRPLSSMLSGAMLGGSLGGAGSLAHTYIPQLGEGAQTPPPNPTGSGTASAIRETARTGADLAREAGSGALQAGTELAQERPDLAGLGGGELAGYLTRGLTGHQSATVHGTHLNDLLNSAPMRHGVAPGTPATLEDAQHVRQLLHGENPLIIPQHELEFLQQLSPEALQRALSDAARNPTGRISVSGQNVSSELVNALHPETSRAARVIGSPLHAFGGSVPGTGYAGGVLGRSNLLEPAYQAAGRLSRPLQRVVGTVAKTPRAALWASIPAALAWWQQRNGGR